MRMIGTKGRRGLAATLATLCALVFATAASAADCTGRDLIAELPAGQRAQLDEAAASVDGVAATGLERLGDAVDELRTRLEQAAG